MENRPLADGGVDRQPSECRVGVTAEGSSNEPETVVAQTNRVADGAVAPDRRSWFNGLLRWGYVVPRLLLVAIVWAFFAYGFDPLLRYGIVTGGESVLGAKVDVELVQTQFFPPVFQLKSVGVTDPRRTDENAATFDEITVRIAGEPLLHGEYVIEEAAIRGVRINADRLTDGTLDPNETAEGEGLNLEPLQQQLELIGLQWYDQLEATAKKELDPRSLETVQVAESVETQWQQRLDDMKGRINALQQRIDAVKDLTRAKGDPLNKLDSYSRATTEVQSILQESQRIRIDVRKLPAIARADVSRLDEARKRDTARLKQRMQSLPLNPGDISKSLLGPQLADRLSAINNWVGWMRRYFSTDAIQPPAPQTRGEWIVFPRAQKNPTFVLKALTLSGEVTKDGQPFAMTAECLGVSSDPALYGQPTEWRFEMAGPDPLAIVGHSDLTADKPLHEVAFNWQANRPIRQTIGDDDKLAITLTAGSARCDGWLRLDGDKLEGEVHLVQQPLSVSVNESADKFAQRWIAPALSSVRSADATLQLFGTLDDIDWQVQSDVGPQIAAGFQQLLANEVDTQRAKLLAKADAVARQQMNNLPSVVDDQVRYLLADLTSRESRAKQAIAKLTGGKLDVRKVSDKLNLGRLLRR